MESSNPGTSLAKFTKLQPKNPIDEELAMSKVHISKNWKLPPRLKPGRRPQVKAKSREDEEGETPEEQSKKKKQNRDAQRAYRERRANRLQELETNVATLQSVVKGWKRKYKDLELQFQNAQAENSKLKQQMEDIKSSVCQLCFKEPCVCNKNSATLFQDPFLQDMVKNFKPMKAVNLKRRKVGSPKSPESSMPPQLDSVSSGSCGFCSDSTACVCKDMQTSTVTLGNCSSKSSATCDNCADIDKSCLATNPPEMKSRPSQGKWEPGSCAQCKIDPASRAYCKSVCNPATIMATIESQGSEDCSCLNTEPGTCTKCQEDPERKEFCQAIFLNKPQPSTVESKSELIPVSDAYQKIRNYMQSEEKSEDSRSLLLPLRQIVSGLRVRGREVESKSVDDALRDMDKNALQ